ncbi:MAG TPA: CstA-like transporter-associated (seleno)protein [Lysobacter sp.]|nr:CstA-like transporter-associated (seleno)protein [Lysobacter sp.]
MRSRLRAFWRIACQTARMAIGVPDYDAYVAHVRDSHPERMPMSRKEFFRERMTARYGRGRSRCC